MSKRSKTKAAVAARPTVPATGRIVIVTGMSGAGLTTALKAMEDMGFEAVDNLPLRLMSNLVRQGPAPGPGLAVGIDVRTRDFGVVAFAEEMASLRAETGYPLDVLFLDCDDEVLRLRYTETRRRHPLAEDRPVLDGIIHERRLLAPLRDAANVIIDTSHMNLHQFGQRIRGHFGGALAGDVGVFVTSFAYRRGLPRDADLVFDVRFLRNPHYDTALRLLTGSDSAVADYIRGDAGYAAFYDQLIKLLAVLLPRFDREGKSYLTIAVGCTGGRHRSVFVAEELGGWLRARGARVAVLHRELALAEAEGGATP